MPPKRHRLTAACTAMLLVMSACSSADGEAATGVVSSTTVPDQSSVETTTIVDVETTSSVAETEPEPTPIVDACVTQRRPAIGLRSGAIESGGNEYSIQWVIPSRYDGEPVPLVLDFHGIGSNGAQQGVLSGFGTLAEAEGFVVAEPTGTVTSLDSRNSWELPQFETDERDDVAFVLDLIDFLRSEVCVDQTRIYSAGMSNGGFFTSVLVCELAERIAAAVSVAGVTHDDSCTPARPVPYLAFHGTADTVVPYNGGGESTVSGGASGAFFEQIMPDEFAEFADDFGCTGFEDTAVTEEVSLRRWSGCADDAELGFYTIDGGGHTWPGSSISAAIPSLGVTNLDIDATAVAWDFFGRHQLGEPAD